MGNIKASITDEKNLNTLLSIAIIVFSSALMAISTCMFLNPLGLYGGGTTGLAQIIVRIFALIKKEDFSIYQNSISYINFLLLIPFNILAFFKLSKKYAFYTMISTVVQTIFYAFSSTWSKIEIFKSQGQYDVIACVIVAAAINGITNGLLMRRGATSGGFTTLSQYLNIKKGKSVGGINLITSATIMVVGAIISYLGTGGDGAFSAALSTALYTLIYFVLGSIVLDYIHTSYNKVKIEIVSENGTKLADDLLTRFPHGITIEKGLGAYTRREKTILSVVVSKYECNQYIHEILNFDSKAFVTVVPICRFTGNFHQLIINK